MPSDPTAHRYRFVHALAFSRRGSIGRGTASTSSKIRCDRGFGLRGYPASPVKGRPILGLEDVLKSTNYRDRWVNIAGVASGEQGYVATGGRVLSCTAMGDDLRSTQESAYTLMRELHLEGGHYRSDIAHRALL